MKVLHIVKTAVGANWAYEQVCGLCSLGMEIVVALPSETEGLASGYRKAGATVIRANLDLPAREPWRIPHALRLCRELAKSVRPDLIHTHHVGTTFVVRLALGKNSPIPRVFGVTGTLHLEHGFLARLDLRLAGPQDHWIATCQWTQRRYHELGIPPDRVFLAYLGTDLANYREKRTGTLRKALGITPDVSLIGMVSYIYAPKWFVGRWTGHKGHEDFIAALASVLKARKDVRGVIIGGAWGNSARYEKKIRYLGERLCGNGLTFLGTRTDMLEIYPDLDLAVVPTYSDGLAYSVIEPLLAGVPVVATNVGGLPDLIHDGRTGWLVPPRNPQTLAEAILDALSRKNEARRRAVEGQKAAQRLIDVHKTARDVVAAYEAILKQPRVDRLDQGTLHATPA